MIIDLRNTVGGGDNYSARAILGRCVTENMPFQIDHMGEYYGDHPAVERLWTEYVTPREGAYEGTVRTLVGHYTAVWAKA